MVDTAITRLCLVPQWMNFNIFEGWSNIYNLYWDRKPKSGYISTYIIVIDHITQYWDIQILYSRWRFLTSWQRGVCGQNCCNLLPWVDSIPLINFAEFCIFQLNQKKRPCHQTRRLTMHRAEMEVHARYLIYGLWADVTKPLTDIILIYFMLRGPLAFTYGLLHRNCWRYNSQENL